MDSSIIPSTIPSSSSSPESESSTVAIFNRATFLSTYIPNQQWSLPDSIIYYISKNPSTAKVHGKLIQSCKYFLIRNPPIVVKELNLVQYGDELNIAFDEEPVDFNTIISKIWLCFHLTVASVSNQFGQNSLSILIPKICRSNIKELFLYDQICSINHLKFLGSKSERVCFDKTIVRNEDGAMLTIEEIFQLFPRVNHFEYHFDAQRPLILTPTTLPELIKIPKFSDLQYLDFFDAPESFDIDVFYAYMKKNKKTNIYLDFCIELSLEYRNHLQAIVNEIVGDESRNYKPPCIFFRGIDESVFDRMFDLYDQE